MSARPNIGLGASRSPMFQISSLEMPEIRNTEVSPFLGLGMKAAGLTVVGLSVGLHHLLYRTNLDSISVSLTDNDILNIKDRVFSDFPT